jgi:hypothetical protein
MPSTSPRVAFGLYALAIKQDSFPSCPDLQAYSNILDLKTNNAVARPFATYEPNFWLLDGNYKFMPTDYSNVHVGLVSESMSDADGLFAVDPVLTVTFGLVHSTNGLAFRFSAFTDDYVSSMDVAFYDDVDALIRTDTYAPTGVEFSTGQAVADFKKIIITFKQTSKPYRYARLKGLDYGTLIYFTGADIKSASVVEEVNPLSVELPVDTLELSLFSTNADFSIIDPAGDYALLQDKQPLDVYEEVGTEQRYIGQFYLDTWENTSDNTIVFKAVDMIGVLDTVPYMGGIWLTPVTVETLFAEIMEAISTPYDLDADLNDVELEGWIPICSYRDALQQIAFAAGAYISCSRSGVMAIKPFVLASDLIAYDATITKAEKGAEQSLGLKPLITGVEITAHNYIANADVTELYNGTLAAGLHTITFGKPMHDLNISGATITESGANYAIVNVASPGTVTLSGEGYTDTTRVQGLYNETLDPNTKTNIVGISDATLVNPSNVDVTIQRVYDYYLQRHLQKVKLFSPVAAVGNSVIIDTLYNRQIGGIVEKMSLDLSGGFLVQAEITGTAVAL